MTILETKDLRKFYGSGDTQVKALDGVDLSVENGEFVAIVGTSGSGKSTLLHMLGGLDRPTSGAVLVDGKDIFSLKDEELTIFRRRKIGFVFQSYNLVPVLSVYENIVLPIQLDGGKVDQSYVNQVIEALGAGAEAPEPAQPALWGTAAARGHRPGSGHQARYHPGRRAHRQPGLQNQSGRALPDEGHRAEVRPDHGDDHPQRGDRPDGRPHRPH